VQEETPLLPVDGKMELGKIAPSSDVGYTPKAYLKLSKFSIRRLLKKKEDITAINKIEHNKTMFFILYITNKKYKRN
jgi:hypothetical protein